MDNMRFSQKFWLTIGIAIYLLCGWCHLSSEPPHQGMIGLGSLIFCFTTAFGGVCLLVKTFNSDDGWILQFNKWLDTLD